MFSKFSGFTAVELVLTLTIAAIVGITAIPIFADLGGSQAEGVARKLVSDLSYARRLARSRNGVYGITFNAGADQYTVSYYDLSSGAETPVTDPLTGTDMLADFSRISGIFGLKGIDIRTPNFGGGAKALFSPEGVPADATGLALTTAGSVVLAGGGRTFTVSVQPNTGMVRYQ